MAPDCADRLPGGGAAVYPRACRVSHRGPAGRIVAVYDATAFSGGRRGLPRHRVSQQETIPHLVNRLDIDTDAAFDDVRHRYESLVPTIDFAKLTDLIEAGDLTRVQQYTAELAPHSFVNFWTFDPTPMMHLAGPRTRAITYMMGNNVIVETMFRHDPV
jgi:hypothetical protein